MVEYLQSKKGYFYKLKKKKDHLQQELLEMTQKGQDLVVTV